MTAPRLGPTVPRHLWWLALVLAIAVALTVVTRREPRSRPETMPVANEPGLVAPLTEHRAI